MNLILVHWKSTVSGFLTASLATSAAFLAPPLNAYIPPKVVLWLGAFQIIGKIWIGLISKDAGTVEAIVPGSSTPQSVPAHEIPDDPKAVVVKPASQVVTAPTPKV
jgi:hypothetical protein